jgi:hypothetical protein
MARAFNTLLQRPDAYALALSWYLLNVSEVPPMLEIESIVAFLRGVYGMKVVKAGRLPEGTKEAFVTSVCQSHGQRCFILHPDRTFSVVLRFARSKYALVRLAGNGFKEELRAKAWQERVIAGDVYSLDMEAGPPPASIPVLPPLHLPAPPAASPAPQVRPPPATPSLVEATAMGVLPPSTRPPSLGRTAPTPVPGRQPTATPAASLHPQPSRFTTQQFTPVHPLPAFNLQPTPAPPPSLPQPHATPTSVPPSCSLPDQPTPMDIDPTSNLPQQPLSMEDFHRQQSPSNNAQPVSPSAPPPTPQPPSASRAPPPQHAGIRRRNHPWRHLITHLLRYKAAPAFSLPHEFSNMRISRRANYPSLGWEQPAEPTPVDQIPLNHGKTDFPMPVPGQAIFPKDPSARSQQRRIFAVKPTIYRPAEGSVQCFKPTQKSISMHEAWAVQNEARDSHAVKRPRASSEGDP